MQSALVNGVLLRGVDNIISGAGNDTINPGLGLYDTVNGGIGNDLLIFDYSAGDTGRGMYLSVSTDSEGSSSGYVYRSNSTGSYVDYVSFSNINNFQVTGTPNNDTLEGGAGNNTINGGAGDDSINGDDGVNTIDGGAGNDRVNLNLSTQTGNLSLTLGTGFTLAGVATISNIENFTITTGSGNDSIAQVSLINNLVFRGTDNLSGGAGNDTLNPGLGVNETVSGGAGDDLLILDYSAGDSGRGMYLNTSTDAKGASSGSAYRYDNTNNFLDYLSFSSINRFQITGTSSNDTIEGGIGNDTLSGGAGNDTLNGGAGDDSINAGAGDDSINAGIGIDSVDGGEGNDRLTLDFSGQTGNLSLALGTGFTINGIGSVSNIENFNITTGWGNDSILQSTLVNGVLLRGADNIISGAGNDTINPGLGLYDTVNGGIGNDLLILDYSAGDTGRGMYLSVSTDSEGSSSGYVYRSNSTGSYVDYVSFSNINNFQVTGTPNNDTLEGGAGNNTINGGAGDDSINGDDGVNTIDGGAGNDRISLNLSSQTGNLSLTLGTGFTLAGVATISNIENFTITTGTGNDIIVQSAFANGTLFRGVDNLSGGAGNDTINPGLGLNDTVNGGIGNDLLILDYSAGDTGNGLNLSIYTDSEGSASGNASRRDSTNNNYLDYVSISGINQFQVTGTTGNDTLEGGSSSDTINGGGGNDRINGGAGNDSLSAGAGDDTIDAGTGIDTVDGGADNDRLTLNLSGQTANLNLNLGSGFVLTGVATVSNIENFYITSGSGNDSILQSPLVNGSISRGSDSISGGAGNDTLGGGLGYDTVNGDVGEDMLIIDYSAGDTGRGMYLYTSTDRKGGSSGAAYRYDTNNNFYLDNLSFSSINTFQITGTTKNDTITGGGGNDTINGNGGLDNLDGGAGADRFVLGNASGQLYDDNNNTTAGTTDYARITGFNPTQDTIQLRGNTAYRLLVNNNNTEIYIDKPVSSEPDELIGIVEGVINLNLNSTVFIYAVSGNEFQFSAANFSVNENGVAIAAVVITRAGASQTAASVTVTPINSSATSPDDYNGSAIVVNFAAGETSKTVNIPIVDDSLVEGNETINLALSNPTSGASLGLQNTAILTIVDNDVAVPDNAGNSIDTARDISILNGTQSFSDFLDAVDRNDFYRFELLRNSTFNLTLNGLSADANIELLNGAGVVIGSSTNSGTTAETLNQTLNAGVYYLRAHRVTGQTNYNLSVTATPIVTPFGITGLSPNTGSNTGPVTVTIKGNRFTNLAAVSIIAPNNTTRNATNTVWQDENTLIATFNLAGLSAGAYDVRVTDSTGNATQNDVLNIISAPAGQLETFLSVPGGMRPFWTREATITYRNNGSTDIAAPLLTLSADNALFFSDTTNDFTASTIQFLGIGAGNAGTLAPGETGTYKIKFKPASSTVTNIRFSLNTIKSGETIDWNSLRDASRPPEFALEVWNVIFNNFTSSIGNRTDNHQAALGENATYLSQLGEYVRDVAGLLSFELQQASNSFPFPTVATSVDATAPTPGLSLVFGRSYQLSLTGRLSSGIFGRGWTTPWDSITTVDNDGNVSIESGDTSRTFFRRSDGTYGASEGDYGILTLQSGIYTLREKNGTVRVFRGDGRLNYVQDSNSNRITLVYTGTQLTALTHSNGDRFTFTYNAQGRLTSLTDQAGRVTTYSYDTGGERLLTVTGPTGTTSYTYDNSTTGANAYALRSTTFPDGIQSSYNYDANGRLTQTSLNTGAETVIYTYDSAGGVTVGNGTGNNSRLLFNSLGQTQRSTDSLGRQTEFGYDEKGNLTTVIAPDNTTSNFIYDNRGNLLTSINPLGQRVEFNYEPQYSNLASVRDARGNLIAYAYNNQGNLSSINYADGSRESFTYDTQGNITVSVNRRGQDIDYTYDSRGLLLTKTYPDGTRAAYTYDARGNLLTATDSDSNISYTYDTADRLIRVTYGSGRFLQFTYDGGGRRTRMVDQTGATVNYLYDAAGRISGLRDGNNQNIVAYIYDAAGRLLREDNGNGTYTTYTYDAASQLRGVFNYTAANALNSRFEYTYDNLGRRTSVSTVEGITTYTYDAAGQLTSVTLPNNRRIQYSYDAAGNRISVTDSGVASQYSTNNLNQYTSVAGTTYTYDPDGNLTRRVQGGQTWNYTYDIENRLIGVTNGSDSWTYEYDALGNRIASVRNGQRSEFLLDPAGQGDVVGEYSGSGSLIALYVHGLGLVSRSDGGGNSYYDTDAIGSVIGLSGSSGSYVNRYSYLPFGENLSKTETVSNPFEYAGQWGVMEDGNGLNFMRARFYDPQTGRFTGIDPLGIGAGDANLYRYSLNNPVSHNDPTGQILFAPILIGAGIGAAMDIGTQLIFNGGNFSDISWGSVAISAGLGALGGGIGSGSLVRQAGKEWSHWIPSRFSNPNSKYYQGLPRWLTENGLNGNFVSPVQHALNDPFRYRFMPRAWKDLNPINNPWLRQFNRIPDWLKGSFIGGLLGSAGTQVSNSFDPNDIVGPAGYGTQKYLTPNQTFPYTVRFENQPTATAPAVFVTITHPLDTDLDLNTFELGDFGFGNIYIDVPQGLKAYTTRVDLTQTKGYFVDFQAALNTTNRTVTWRLTTTDPITGDFPDDVNAGFLPPNNASRDGEGFVDYSIRPLANLPTGTAIDARASIVFDINAPINTPTWTNTVDVSDPTSSVTALPAFSTNPNFTVSWTGSDNGSGIASYDVYVSVNGSAYTLWLDDTVNTSATYNGQVASTYAFYSVARDNVNNLQTLATSAQATTTVINLPSLAVNDVTVVEGNVTSAIFTVTLSAASLQAITVQYGTANGTATGGSDYTGVTTTTLSFAPGETSKTITIPILNDNINEPNETFTFNLTTPTNATIADAQGIGTISDTLSAIVTTTLPALVENLALVDGAGNINGTGNAGNNIITGNSGNNRLDGAGGIDTLIGGAGDDTYIIDTTTDTLTEASGGGTDTIETNLTLNLNNYLNIENVTLSGIAALNATGNALNNLLTGNGGNNTLDGGAGNDTLNGGAGVDSLIGGVGDDTYIVDTTTDTVRELANEGTDTINVNYTFNLATLPNFENLILSGVAVIDGTGTSGNNLIIGNGAANRLTGLEGDDTIDGGAGADNLVGGAGNDTYGVDSLSDVVTEVAGAGTDTILASINYTLATANVENLALAGGANINATGDANNNVVTGNTGNNRLDGGAGIDTLIGGAGNDTYVIDTTGDTLTEAVNGGVDTIEIAQTFALTNYANIENLLLTGTTNINGTGNTLNNLLTGNSGNNTLDGGLGNDTLNGGLGVDNLIGGLGNDTYILEGLTDTFTEAANAGTDTLQINQTYNLSSAPNIENLTLTGTAALNGTGTAGNNLLIGNSGVNTLTGNEGNDTLDGGVGNDNLIGGTGDDTYIVDSSGDVITEGANAGTDTVQASFNFTLTNANLENLSLIGIVNITATGNSGVNNLTGNSGNNRLSGEGGNDILVGGAGNDTLIGGAGSDTLTGGAGLDSFLFNGLSEGVDRINDFVPADDTINVSAAGFGGGLTANSVLAIDRFTIGTAATTTDHRFIYNSTTGALLFDADGNLSGSSQQLATLGTGLAMTNEDIFILA